MLGTHGSSIDRECHELSIGVSIVFLKAMAPAAAAAIVICCDAKTRAREIWLFEAMVTEIEYLRPNTSFTNASSSNHVIEQEKSSP